ncbi:MAG: exosome complex protein Rrp42 [Candidatus Woesearchaeota archaeon]
MNEELRNHIEKLLSKNVRIDSRKKLDYRDISIEVGFLKTAEGSARVKIGETEIIAGVKMSIEKPFPDTPEDGLLMIGTELLPLSNPKYEGGPPSIESIEVSRVIDRAIRESRCIDTKKLCIEKGEKAWTVNVDLCPINDDGNLFDAGFLAAMAALLNTRFPEYDGEKVDYTKKTNKNLPINKIPISVTVLKIGENFFVDPLEDEENVIDARLTVASLDENTLCALQKGGDHSLRLEDIKTMIEISIEKARELRKYIKQ